VGYRHCRVAYRPLLVQLWERLTRRPILTASEVERIGTVSCVRLNTAGGFQKDTLRVVRRVCRTGGIAVCYAHPHSLSSDNSQSWRYLIPFLREITELRKAGSLCIGLPSEVMNTI